MKNALIVLVSLFAVSAFANEAAKTDTTVKHEVTTKSVKKGKKGAVKTEEKKIEHTTHGESAEAPATH
jgi:hypothetical protein